MKKFLFVGLAGLMIFGFFLDMDLDSLLDTEITTMVQDQGDIQVYFCPHQDCETALVNFIDSAEESIHCALFELDLEQVQKKLLEKQKVMEVQVVTDNDYLYEFNHSFVKTDSWGLMHNKFCIVDGKKLSTGSMNPTNNGAFKNDNNLLLIDSKVLARNYEDEFQEMWNGTYKKGKHIKNPVVNIGNITLKNYFCPEDDCAEKVKEELKKAAKTIHFMTFSFTHEGIGNILLLKNKDGVEVKGVMEARQVTKYSQFKRLRYQEIDVIKDGNPANMHHKVFIIDGSTVITGSFNPSKGGDSKNDENILVIKDAKIAQLFEEEFEMVYLAGQK